MGKYILQVRVEKQDRNSPSNPGTQGNVASPQNNNYSENTWGNMASPHPNIFE